ncbi:ubiquitin-protein ligase domain-containing protein [Cavenderia fasciculata]|uniref:HECT-type E3 ubiquitin transferase n=1 Tax=Cavenderia fasciculata TaxID=261658 RepID=F4QE41_CACFS|nr:ubiquitin-protein ligase domain-containing protein [Cavenderia fasciculata]EGG13988.1 ubiquitin-protein ligase domain-containing protein [Cavenderia fasciculata]|eukprot:XP_004350696.1 ubiquitin-protein ligase domain-containing protein [Cavenderia fasciculata]
MATSGMIEISLSIGEWILNTSGIKQNDQYSVFTIVMLVMLLVSIRYYLGILSYYSKAPSIHKLKSNSQSLSLSSSLYGISRDNQYIYNYYENNHHHNHHQFHRHHHGTIATIAYSIQSFIAYIVSLCWFTNIRGSGGSGVGGVNPSTSVLLSPPTISTHSRPLSPSLPSLSSSTSSPSTTTSPASSSPTSTSPSISGRSFNQRHENNKPYVLGITSGTIGTIGDKFSFVVVSQPHLFNSGSSTVNHLISPKSGQMSNKREGRSSDIVTIAIQGHDLYNMDEHAQINVIDRKNGTFSVYFSVTKSGTYTINIFVNQVLLSPYSVYLSPVQYSFFLTDVDSKQNMIVAGEEFNFEITPTKIVNQKINDQVSIDTFVNENGVMKKISNDFTLYSSTDPEGFHGRGKLIRSGDYVIEGSVQGILVFSKAIRVEAGCVSPKYSQIMWHGKELISENKFFILEENKQQKKSSSPSSNVLKFLIVTKDQFGNPCNGEKYIGQFNVECLRSFSPLSNETFINNKQQQCNFTTKLEYTITKDEEFERGLIVSIPINQCGWYTVNFSLNGVPLLSGGSSPYTLISISKDDYSHLSTRYTQGISSFPCQIEKNKKFANVNLNITSSKIEITENYYITNLVVYEFTINPTIQIQLLNEKEILIKDNKTKIIIHNCTNTFLILLTAYYFFGDQTEPSFDSKCKWLKDKLNKIQNNERLKPTPLKLNISSRDNILEESLDILKNVNGKNLLTTRIIVKFENEEGVDVGGISKEWFSKFSQGMGESSLNGYRMFECKANDRYQPSPFSNLVPEYKTLFRTLGRIAAKSIFESVLKADRHLSIHFTPSFYKRLLNEPVAMEDVESLDPVLYRNLFQYLLNNPMEQVNQVLGDPLYFVHHIYDNTLTNTTTTEQSSTNASGVCQNGIQSKQEYKVVNLKPFGNLIRVTDENKEEYLQLLADHMMYGSIKTQIDEFKEGFYQLLPQEFISIFTWKELEILICGKSNVSVDDLKAHSNITGFVSEEIVNHFWKILNEFGEEEKKSLLRFVTGSSSVPLGGFFQLYPHFTVNITPNTSVGRLPVSHTCFNRIDIPRGLTSYHTLKQNILTAISEASEGFSLV